nr:hypothetical protein [uncultured Psychroserpens sp.]
MKTINAINGINLHYARTTSHPYGTIGVHRVFEIDDQFLITLKAALKEVFDHCPLGAPKVITTAGIKVIKPGQHRHGKAFDLDAIFWDNHSLITNNFIHQKVLYLGIESFLRKHFGIVLNHFYPNHADHWHVDTSVPVDYDTNAKSETLYVQLVLQYVYGKSLIIDGVWGKQTSTLVDEVFARLNINTPITTIVNYKKFLTITGKIAFKLSEDAVTPLDLLENLEAVVDDLPTTNKHEVRQALNSFVLHTETQNWFSTLTDSHDLEAVIDSVIS